MKPTTLEKILKATKLLPENERKALVSELYVDSIAERNYDLLSTITTSSNIPFPEVLIQQAYEKEAGYVNSKMVDLYEATKIRPPEELIQKAYLVCIENSGFLRKGNNISLYHQEGGCKTYNKFKLLIETFKSKPSDLVLLTAKKSYRRYYSYLKDPGYSYIEGWKYKVYQEAKGKLQRILEKVEVRLDD